MLNWLKQLWSKRTLTYDHGVHAGLALPTLAGTHVDEDSCLGISAVWCAVRTISSTISLLPLTLYRRLPQGGKEEATEHPLYWLLKSEPNSDTDKELYWETVLASALTWGNSYSEIERDEAGRPVGLHLLPPNKVSVGEDSEVGRYYEIEVNFNNKVILPSYNVFHLAGLGNGCVGYSPIALHRETLAATKAARDYGSAFFGNAARPSGYLSIAGQLSDNARENLRKSWQQLHQGVHNTGRVAVLEEGLSFTSISLPNEEAQFIETMNFNLSEVARIFQIPNTLLMDYGRATWANATEMRQAFIDFCLLPWCRKIESQISKKLLSQEERKTYFASHNFDALLKGDMLSRYNAHKIAIEAGFKLRSEVRDEENLNPLPNMDEPTLKTTIQEDADGTQEPATSQTGPK